MKKKMKKKRPYDSTIPVSHASSTKEKKAVILGMFINGATMQRHLCKIGCRVWGVSHIKEEGFYSRYGIKILCPDPEKDFEKWTAFMVELGKEIGDRPALIPTSDYYVVAVGNAVKQLGPYYRFHGFGSRIKIQLTYKHSQMEIAERNGLPVPKWKLVRSVDDVLSFAYDVKSKIILKPVLSHQWRFNPDVFGSRKVLIAERVSELIKLYKGIEQYCDDLVAIEYIPGPDENLFYWCGFANEDSTIGGSIIGQKKRLNPIHFGSASYVQLIREPALEQLCSNFIKRIHFQGLCGIEVKRDSDDGYKLIEINPRYGLWEDIGIPVGVDLAKQAVDSLYGDHIAPVKPHSYNIRWVAWHRDIPMLPHYLKEKYGFFKWIWSLRPPIIINDLPLFDMKYILKIFILQLYSLLNRIYKRHE
jgi:predicted ATP-grasp superfamily ATP-dependent carboligase